MKFGKNPSTLVIFILFAAGVLYVLYESVSGPREKGGRKSDYGASSSSQPGGSLPIQPAGPSPVTGTASGRPGATAVGGSYGSDAGAPAGTNGESRDLAELFHHASELAATGMYERALEVYQEILSENPEHPFTLVNVARIHFIQGRTEEAITHLQKANRVMPGSAKTLSYLGMAEGKAGRFEEAVVHLKQSLTVDPTAIEVRHHLAGAYYELGKDEEARAEWTRVLEQDPENPQARYGLQNIQERDASSSSDDTTAPPEPGSTPH